jgi:hypothetical protein
LFNIQIPRNTNLKYQCNFKWKFIDGKHSCQPKQVKTKCKMFNQSLSTLYFIKHPCWCNGTHGSNRKKPRTSNMFKYLVNNSGRKSSQFTELEYFIQRAMMEAHWISQKLQFVIESHKSRHCTIQSLQQCKISWRINYQILSYKKREKEGYQLYMWLHRIVTLISWVCREKQPEESNTFKCWVMPWIFQQGPVVPVQ